MTRKTTIDVDEELLADAQRALGTRGLKETVDRALEEAVRGAARRRLLTRVETGAGWDIGEPEVVNQAREWRT